MNRTILTSALLLAFAAAGPALAADSPPTTPGKLTAKLYPGAGGELFWSRSSDDRGVRGYEITRNGQSLGVRDALSFYDPSLEANTAYTFSVTAVDTAGQRSGAATASLGGGTSNPSAPTAGGPAAPAGLSAKAYSAKDGELFWTRVPTGALRYEVSRDGTLVKTTDGVSYYDSALSAGRAYTYSVVAIDRSGKRSAASTVSLKTLGTASGQPPTPTAPVKPTTPTIPTTPTTPTTPTAPATPADPTAGSLFDAVGTGSPLSVDNYATFLPAFYRIANAEPLEAFYPKFLKVVDGLRGAQRGDGASRFVAQSTFDASFLVSSGIGTTFACPGGGTVDAEISFAGLGEGAVIANFDACIAESLTWSGTAYKIDSSPGNSSANFGPSGQPFDEPFSVTYGDGLVLGIDADRSAGIAPTYAADYFDWVGGWQLSKGGRKLTVQEAVTRAEDTGAGYTFLHAGKIGGALTNGRLITASDLGAFASTGPRTGSPSVSSGCVTPPAAS